MNRDDERMLEELFAAARTDRPQPSDRLSAAILRDADREGPASTPRRRAALRWPAPGYWLPISGLAAASLVGIAIGFAAPGVVWDAHVYPVTGSPGAGFDVGDFASPYDVLLTEDL